jgi:type IV pilus assembly protein PilN
VIRINLLAAERERSKKKAAVTFGTAGQKMAVGCSLILILSLAFIGWRFWTLSRQSTQLDAEIGSAQQETTRLHSVIQQVQQFEQRKAQLQQRVALIEQLKKGQTGPVHMLDQISRALPPMLWLTELKQTNDDIQIEGKCTNQTAVAELISNLEASGYFKRSIDIVSTTAEASAQAPSGELIKFTLKAAFKQPEAAPAGAGGRGAAPKVGG